MVVIWAFLLLFVVILAGLVTGRVLYKRALRRENWSRDAGLVLVSDDCPHQVRIPYGQASSLRWKRRELRVNTGVFGRQTHFRKTWYRIRCGDCGKKHHYYLVETPETRRFNRIGIRYALGTLAGILLVFGVLAQLLDLLFNL